MTARPAFKARNILLLTGACLAGLGGVSAFAAAADAPATRPTTAPATRPDTQPAAVDPAARSLIDKLADASPKVREDATRKLSEMGKAAVPALQEMADADDPELRARVKALLRHAERRLPPAAPARDGRFQSQSVRMTVNNGSRTVDVNDNGRQVHIEQTPKGIKMSVTGVDEGKEVTEDYAAKDADELKRDNPEAYALYERWGEGNAASVRIQTFNGPNGIRLRAGAIGQDANGQPVIPEDALNGIREMLREQVQAGNLPADQQNRLLDGLNDVEKVQREVRERLEERMNEQEELRRHPAPNAPRPPGPPELPERPPEEG